MRIGLLFLVLMFAVRDGASAASPAPSTASPTPPPAASPSPHASPTKIAPADAYFGPFGMSPLSIRSTIGLLGREYHYRTISDHDLLRKALVTEDALRKWRTAYPADPWLAPTFFHLEQLYQAVQSDEARKHATAILKDVARNYPDTKQGHLSRSRLAAGFPPLVPETPLVATPPPTAAASPPASGPGAASSPEQNGSAPPAPEGSALPVAPAPASPVPAPTSSPRIR